MLNNTILINYVKELQNNKSIICKHIKEGNIDILTNEYHGEFINILLNCYFNFKNIIIDYTKTWINLNIMPWESITYAIIKDILNYEL